MKKFVTGLMALLCLVSVLPVQVFSATNVDGVNISDSTFAQDYEDMYDHKTGYVENSFLGVAQFFTLFGEKVTVANTVNGNIAADELTAKNTFGTDETVGKKENGEEFVIRDHYYIGKVTDINASAFKAKDDKVMFGADNTLQLEENKFKLGNVTLSLDSLSKENTFLESKDIPYLGTKVMPVTSTDEVKQVLNAEEDKSLTLASYLSSNFSDKSNNDIFTTDKDEVEINGFKGTSKVDQNNRYVDVSKVTDKNQTIFVHLSADELIGSSTPITVKGLNVDDSGKISPHVIFVVDTTGKENIDTQIQVKLVDSKGNSITSSSEATGYLKNTNPILWTFVNNSMSANPTVFSGKLTIRGLWIGATLVPGGSIGIGTNTYGNLIARNVTTEGGSAFRWNWGGYASPTVPDEPVTTTQEFRVVKYDADTGEKLDTTTNMSFTLTDQDGTKTNLGSSNEFKISDLAAGEYTISETSAPDGYLLEVSERNFSIDENGKITVDKKEVQNLKTSDWIAQRAKTDGYYSDDFYVDEDGTLVFAKYDIPITDTIKLTVKKYDYNKVMSTLEELGLAKEEFAKNKDKATLEQVDIAENEVTNPFDKGMKISIVTAVGTIVQNADGTWDIPKNAGSITIQETAAPSGYLITDTLGVTDYSIVQFGFTLESDGTISTSDNNAQGDTIHSNLDSIQQDKKGNLIFYKHDKATSQPISLEIDKYDANTGAQVEEPGIRDNFIFSILNNEGTEIYRGTGKEPLPLKTGEKYTIIEKQADVSYIAKTEIEFTFSIDNEGNITQYTEDTVTNNYVDKVVPGVSNALTSNTAFVFQIYDEKVPRTINLQKLGLPDAPEAPEGIITNPEEIDEDALKAMAFTITDTTTKKTDDFTGDYTLEYGHSYVIEETTAPTGYEVTNAKYYFEFTSEGEIKPRSENDAVSGAVNEFTAESTAVNYDTIIQNKDGNFTFLKYDKKTPAKGYLPSTGGKGTQNYFLYGASVFLVVLAYYFIRRKRTTEG
ncbi:prealbumin-like fold domain-containing protein [Enterococcus nangangensis]|uniref:prealbumin-like fold domain-containing protein n=1 Tax=Enterococcus nangangensis TaxID=2559926 RepID=UPI001484FB62|nr:prealbumin-like fold domain-containing protein [Enterococcus nangangensis]